MIDYIVAAAVFLGGIYEYNHYKKKNQILENNRKVCEENERLFKEFTPEKIDKLANALNEKISEKKDLTSKLNSNC